MSQTCPQCSSTDSTWKAKAGKWECNACEERFDGPSRESPDASSSGTEVPAVVISGKKNVPEKQFVKESSDAYEERFSNDLVDYKKTATAIGKASTLTAEEIGRILEGLILSIRKLDRDIGIHLAVIGEWLKRCEDAHSTVGEFFSKEMPPVTGDGRTQESAWFFPWARMQGEGIAMANELMASKGPDYRLRMQELDDEKVVEYWDAHAGRYWFRYPKDLRVGGYAIDSGSPARFVEQGLNT